MVCPQNRCRKKTENLESLPWSKILKENRRWKYEENKSFPFIFTYRLKLLFLQCIFLSNLISFFFIYIYFVKKIYYLLYRVMVYLTSLLMLSKIVSTPVSFQQPAFPDRCWGNWRQYRSLLSEHLDFFTVRASTLHGVGDPALYWSVLYYKALYSGIILWTVLYSKVFYCTKPPCKLQWTGHYTVQHFAAALLQLKLYCTLALPGSPYTRPGEDQAWGSHIVTINRSYTGTLG